jgi:hypothetical protein
MEEGADVLEQSADTLTAQLPSSRVTKESEEDMLLLIQKTSRQ